MQQIDEIRLETDTAYRFEYVAGFMNVSPADIECIHGAASHLGPLVPGLVDAVYEKLFSYDATKRHFVARQHGYEGDVPLDLETLTLDHPMIAFRKQHLGRYLERLVTRPYDGEMINYLDLVGKIHTPLAGSQSISVPLVQMNALMGFVADAMTATIYSLNLPREAEMATVRAFQKLLWVQNDLITRHYQSQELVPTH